MPSAAGIIIATGAMTIANDALQNDAPLSTAVGRINWKIVPATAIAAAIFYGFSQINEEVAKGLAWLAFITAFVGGDVLSNPNYKSGSVDSQGYHSGNLTPLGTLLKVTGNQGKSSNPFVAPGTVFGSGGLPYQATP